MRYLRVINLVFPFDRYIT